MTGTEELKRGAETSAALREGAIYDVLQQPARFTASSGRKLHAAEARLKKTWPVTHPFKAAGVSF